MATEDPQLMSYDNGFAETTGLFSNHNADQAPQQQQPSEPSTSAPASGGSDQASAVALQQFFTLSVAAGITNLGVLLEILHVANYDATKASRIVELVRGDPPTAPAIIASSQTGQGNQNSNNNNDNNNTSNPSDTISPSIPGGVAAQDCAVQAFGTGLTASAAAASPYSAAVVSCAPGSAGVGVGTSSGTTTSTAVPFSAVTSLPNNSVINLDFSTPGKGYLETKPNTATTSSAQAAQAVGGGQGGSGMVAAGQGQSQQVQSRALPQGQVQANGVMNAQPVQQQQQSATLAPWAPPSTGNASVPARPEGKRAMPPLPPASSRTVPGHAATNQTSAPARTTVPSRPAPSSSGDANTRPQSRLSSTTNQPVASPASLSTPQPAATSTLGDMDPLKVAKLQEIIDILKA